MPNVASTPRKGNQPTHTRPRLIRHDTETKLWDRRRFVRDQQYRERAAEEVPVTCVDELRDVERDKKLVAMMLEHLDAADSDKVLYGESYLTRDLLGRPGAVTRIAKDNKECWGCIALPILPKGTKRERTEQAKGRGIWMRFGEVYAATQFGLEWPLNDVRSAAMWTARLAVDSGAYPIPRTPLPSLDNDELVADLQSRKELTYLCIALESFGLRHDIAREFVPRAFNKDDKRIWFTQKFSEKWIVPTARLWVPNADRRWQLFLLLEKHGLLDKEKVPSGLRFPPYKNLFRFAKGVPTVPDYETLQLEAIDVWSNRDAGA